MRAIKRRLATLSILMIPILLAVASPAPAQSQGGTEIPRILVTDQGKGGSAEEGYVVNETTNFGPWGDKPVQDTPFTVNILTEEFIDNVGARSASEVFNYMPGVSGGAAAETNWQNIPRTRGFQSVTSSSIALNGVPTGNGSVVVFTEDLGSIEVLNGLSGFMYGAGNVGGVVNYNIKRPLYHYANKLRFGSYGGGLVYGHADLGGPLAGGRLAYRVNLLLQGGKSPVRPQTMERRLASAALDWNISDRLLVQFNASYGEVRQDGRQGAFTGEWDNPGGALVPGATSSAPGNRTFLPSIPEPPDPSKLWVPSDTFNDIEILNLGANLKYVINDNLSLRAAYAYNQWNRIAIMTINYFTTDPDIYKYSVSALNWVRKHDAGYLYLDAKFDTYALRHELTFGANGFFRQQFGAGSGAQVQNFFTSRFSLRDAVGLDLTGFNYVGRLTARTKNDDTLNYNIVLADDIKFGEKWEFMIGLNHSTFRQRGYNAAGNVTSEYNKSAVTPSLAILFKPAPWLTTYASYIESLEQGTTVSATANPPWKNAGEVFEPMKSRQYEIGAKAMAGGMLLTAALFQVDRTAVFNDTVALVVTQDGNTRHRGLELSARGRLFDSLNLLGGVSFYDAEVTKATNAALVGKTPVDSPKFTGKLYAEYDLPFIDGLTVTGAVNHYGKVYSNPMNNLTIPGYTTLDLGLRLKTEALGTPMIFRLNVHNLTDEWYWFGGSGSHLHLGQPRTFAFSAEVDF